MIHLKTCLSKIVGFTSALVNITRTLNLTSFIEMHERHVYYALILWGSQNAHKA